MSWFGFSFKSDKQIEAIKREVEETIHKEEPKTISARPQGGKRLSEPDFEGTIFGISHSIRGKFVLEPEINSKFIDVIEWLAVWDSDFGQAIENHVSLANTDFVIEFDDAVGDEEAEEMINHLVSVVDSWYNWSEGLHSLGGDLLAQIRIAGAISAEAVIKPDLSGIETIVKVNPKNIRFIPNEERTAYAPAQKTTGFRFSGTNTPGDIIELNPITYKYFALRRFKDNPYAVPPLLTALNPASTKKDMDNSLKFTMRKFGLMGFLDVLMTAPDRQQTESDSAYSARLEAYLASAQQQLERGLNNGVILGFEDTHTFNYHDVKPSGSGLKDTYGINDLNLLTGLKEPPQLMGRTGTTTETFGRVILGKYTESLTDEQKLLGAFYREMFKLELVLAGFKNGALVKDVIFDAPMVGDRVREEEARSKKIDNANKLYEDGVLSQPGRANMLGFEEADQEEPRVSRTLGQTDEEDDDDGSNDDPTNPKTTAANQANMELHKDVFINGTHEARQKIIDYYRNELGASSDEFDYISDATCTCGEHEFALALNDHWQGVLLSMPEDGQGYQVVDVQCSDGELITGARVTNCNTMVSTREDLINDLIKSLTRSGEEIEEGEKVKIKQKKKKESNKKYRLDTKPSLN